MEKKLSVLLVEDDEKECNLIAQYIDELDDVSLVGTTDNSEQGIEYVKDFLPEAIILDLELHQGGGDGLTFLKELRYLNLRVKPYVLVTTNNSSMVTYQCALGGSSLKHSRLFGKVWLNSPDDERNHI